MNKYALWALFLASTFGLRGPQSCINTLLYSSNTILPAMSLNDKQTELPPQRASEDEKQDAHSDTKGDAASDEAKGGMGGYVVSGPAAVHAKVLAS